VTTFWRIVGLSTLCVGLTGCPQIFDALFNTDSPHGLTATTGQGSAIALSWSEPTLEDGDERQVDDYTVSKDGSYLATTASTSYTDHAALPAERHTYTVSASFDDGSVSGESDTEEGWYVPAELLPLAAGPAAWTDPGSHTTADGWLRTLVVEGWTYHFEAEAASTLAVCSWDSPWHQTALPGGAQPSFTWTATRTGKVWLKTGSSSVAFRAWYD